MSYIGNSKDPKSTMTSNPNLKDYDNPNQELEIKPNN